MAVDGPAGTQREGRASQRILRGPRASIATRAGMASPRRSVRLSAAARLLAGGGGEPCCLSRCLIRRGLNRCRRNGCCRNGCWLVGRRLDRLNHGAVGRARTCFWISARVPGPPPVAAIPVVLLELLGPAVALGPALVIGPALVLGPSPLRPCVTLGPGMAWLLAGAGVLRRDGSRRPFA